MTVSDLRGCEYFTVGSTGHRFQLRLDEMREVITENHRDGSHRLSPAHHVGTVVSFDKEWFKVRMYRLGLAWEVKILFKDVTMHNYAERY